jgi:type I restriction enzyme S subunit
MKYVSVQDLVEQNQVVIKTGPFGTQLKASEYVSFGTPVLNVRNLGFATVNTDKLEMVSDGTLERLSAHKLVTGDIVFGRKGAVERHAFISESENGWMQGSDCIRLRVLADSVNPRFLSYYFLTKRHRAFMMSMCSHGTTMASLNQKIIEKIIVPLPERSIQDKVVEILATLDKQIATNQKINENLEQQAQAIFANEFLSLESLPDGWKRGSLIDIADYLNGLAMQKYRPAADEVGIPVLKIKELRQGCCDATSEVCSPNIKTNYIIHDGDVIFSWSGSLLVDFWCGGICGLNQHLFKVTSSVYDKWFYYSWTKHHLERFIAVAADKATTMGHIKRDELSKAEVLIPNKADYIRIGSLLHPIYDLIITNRIESKKLAETRDTLLPKLMSGEIDISEVDYE